MRRIRTVYTVHAGFRQPGGAITWQTVCDSSDAAYVRHVVDRLQRQGHVHRISEWSTTETVPTTADEASWHAARIHTTTTET